MRAFLLQNRDLVLICQVLRVLAHNLLLQVIDLELHRCDLIGTGAALVTTGAVTLAATSRTGASSTAGAIVVDNYTGDRVYVYINGREEGSVGGDNHEYYDREPGLYRVALDGDDSHRSWAADVDVLEGRLTVLKVRGYSGDYDHFDVEVYFD